MKLIIVEPDDTEIREIKSSHEIVMAVNSFCYSAFRDGDWQMTAGIISSLLFEGEYDAYNGFMLKVDRAENTDEEKLQS